MLRSWEGSFDLIIGAPAPGELWLFPSPLLRGEYLRFKFLDSIRWIEKGNLLLL
jgi:hypothetical protein